MLLGRYSVFGRGLKKLGGVAPLVAAPYQCNSNISEVYFINGVDTTFIRVGNVQPIRNE